MSSTAAAAYYSNAKEFDRSFALYASMMEYTNNANRVEHIAMEHKYSPAAAKRDARIVKTSELYRAGNSMRDISTQLGIGLGTVFRDLRAAHEIWRTRAADERQQWIERELATLDWVEVEATRAWIRSIGRTKTIRTETGTSAQGPIQKTSETTDNLAGDPRFLAEIRGCVADRRKLLGLDEPVRTQVQAEYNIAAEMLEKRMTAARERVCKANCATGEEKDEGRPHFEA